MLKNGPAQRKAPESALDTFPEFLASYQHHAKTTQSKLNQLQEEISRYSDKLRGLDDRFAQRQSEVAERERFLKSLQAKTVKDKANPLRILEAVRSNPKAVTKQKEKNVLKLCSLQTANRQLREDISNLRMEKALYNKINAGLLREIQDSSQATKDLMEQTRRAEAAGQAVNEQAAAELRSLEQNLTFTHEGMLLMKNYLVHVNRNLRPEANSDADRRSVYAAPDSNGWRKRQVEDTPMSSKTTNGLSNAQKENFKNRIAPVESADTRQMHLTAKVPSHIQATRGNPRSEADTVVAEGDEKEEVLRKMETRKNQLIAELKELQSFFRQLFVETGSNSVEGVLTFYGGLEDEKTRLYLENEILLNQIKALKESKAQIQTEIRAKMQSLVRRNEVKDLIAAQGLAQCRETQTQIDCYTSKKQEINQIVAELQLALPVVLERIGRPLSASEATQLSKESITQALYGFEVQTNRILRSIQVGKTEEELFAAERTADGRRGEAGVEESLGAVEETLSELTRVAAAAGAGGGAVGGEAADGVRAAGAERPEQLLPQK